MLPFFKRKTRKKMSSFAPVTLLPGCAGEHYLQQKYGTTERALRFYDKQVLNYLSPVMQEFIARQEILFIATADKHGDCDCSFRFGKPGFVRVLNENYVAYPEYRGNGVMASQGNIVENPHIGMILVDFFSSTVGLHINGKAKIVEQEQWLSFRTDLPEAMLDEINAEGPCRPERWIMVEIEEAYIHCSKHIPLLQKAEKQIAWGSDDDRIKRSDFFALDELSLYQRIGGESAISAIADVLTRKFLLDERLGPLLKRIPIQTLLENQRYFLKQVFGAAEFKPVLPESGALREFFRMHIDQSMNDAFLKRAVEHLQATLQELDVPAHEVEKIMTKLSAN